MKKPKPTKHSSVVFNQLCKLIPITSTHYMDWAKHRRCTAAAKLHLWLNFQTFLPSFAVIEEGFHHDSHRMMALCAGSQAR